jgi:small subunit ribosomal protein S9
MSDKKTESPAATAGSGIRATGRRKTAVASVQLLNGQGTIRVNGRDFEEYFPTQTLQELALASASALSAQKEFDIMVRVRGGGPMGQAGAMRHALARALVRADAQNRAKLKQLGFLTRDPRSRERKKSGQPGARKRFQFSKR